MYSGFGGMFGCLGFVVVLVLVGFPMWRIFEKIGYPGVASLIMYVPFVNFIALWYAALTPMPFELRMQGGMPPYGQPPYGGQAPPPPPPPVQR